MQPLRRPDLAQRVGWLQFREDAGSYGEWEPVDSFVLADTVDEMGLSYDGLEMVSSLVRPETSCVWLFQGRKVPPTRNTMAKSPLGTLLIISVDDGDVHVLDISRQAFDAYDLGEDVSVYMIQEFKGGLHSGIPLRWPWTRVRRSSCQRTSRRYADLD